MELSLKVVTETQKHVLLLAVGCVAFKGIFGHWRNAVIDIDASCTVDATNNVKRLPNRWDLDVDLVQLTPQLLHYVCILNCYRGNQCHVLFVSHMTHAGWVELVRTLCSIGKETGRWQMISSTQLHQRLQEKA